MAADQLCILKNNLINNVFDLVIDFYGDDNMIYHEDLEKDIVVLKARNDVDWLVNTAFYFYNIAFEDFKEYLVKVEGEHIYDQSLILSELDINTLLRLKLHFS